MPNSRLSDRALRTRRAILQAAEQFFAERGFAATRLEDIAEQVGIRRASIVYYFRDKRELYDAVLSDVFGELLEKIRTALTAPGPLAERVEAAVSAWVDTVGQRPALARLLLREMADASPEGLAGVLRQTQPFVELVNKVIEETRSDPLAIRSPIEPVHLASTIAGATVFFVAGVPALVPDLRMDPLSAEQLEVHREELLRITRRLLGTEG